LHGPSRRRAASGHGNAYADLSRDAKRLRVKSPSPAPLRFYAAGTKRKVLPRSGIAPRTPASRIPRASTLSLAAPTSRAPRPSKTHEHRLRGRERTGRWSVISLPAHRDFAAADPCQNRQLRVQPGVSARCSAREFLRNAPHRPVALGSPSVHRGNSSASGSISPRQRLRAQPREGHRRRVMATRSTPSSLGSSGPRCAVAGRHQAAERAAGRRKIEA